MFIYALYYDQMIDGESQEVPEIVNVTFFETYCHLPMPFVFSGIYPEFISLLLIDRCI